MVAIIYLSLFKSKRANLDKRIQSSLDAAQRNQGLGVLFSYENLDYAVLRQGYDLIIEYKSVYSLLTA